MRPLKWILAAVFVFAMTISSLAHASSPVLTTYHNDHRSSPKFDADPTWRGAKGQSGETMVRDFLSDQSARYGLAADLSDLRLGLTQESLLGTHYRFQQQIEGVDVRHGEIVVSVSKRSGQIYRVYNNIFPAKPGAYDAAASAMPVGNAYDIAWNHLRVHGDLDAPAAARLVWVPEGPGFRLGWIVELSVTAPYGGWEVIVDATTGGVVSTRDTRIYRVKDSFTTTPVEERIGAYSGPIRDRLEAFGHIEAKRSTDTEWAASIAATGSGVVFDPDPRTTLADDNLQDANPPSAFTAAYFTRSLLDITEVAGTYSLTGPWVTIIDFDTPSTAPSTTLDGNWTATRGDNSFNDAMTYFHLDQNQRYMQGLGFTGASGIQEGPIGADTDGFQGQDNSFYQPSTNRLSFGHGCVDDNEDADVILHEYGHAINHDINPSWTGGDTGAMGEGFGDYWAGSYSFSTPNGPTYHPEWIYSWDGHGTGNLCWPGRIMNAFGALYVHTTTYGAHTSIPGGYVSDELWSTPLFQTLIALDAQSVPRGEVDAIILEAQFGLGSGIKMRDMAYAILQTASTLYPSGPHASIFNQKFLVHDIVELLAAAPVALPPNPVAAGANGVADPGETIDVQIDLINEGTVAATGVSAVLSATTPGPMVISGASNYPDIAPGATQTQLTNYTIHIPWTHACGDPIPLSLEVTYTDTATTITTLPVELTIGVPIEGPPASTPSLAIPDNTPAGIIDTILVSGTATTVPADINVEVDITHTWIGDLYVTLRSPSGTTVLLHDRTGSSADDIVGNYPNTITPAQSLAALVGEPLDGEWELIVSDNAGLDTGTLNSWRVNFTLGYNCDNLASGVEDGDKVPTSFRLYSAFPNPFEAGATIRFDVPNAGANVTIEVFDVAGRKVRTLSQSRQWSPGTHSVTWNGLTASGQPASAGIYFYRLRSGTFNESRKMILIR